MKYEYIQTAAVEGMLTAISQMYCPEDKSTDEFRLILLSYLNRLKSEGMVKEFESEE